MIVTIPGRLAPRELLRKPFEWTALFGGFFRLLARRISRFGLLGVQPIEGTHSQAAQRHDCEKKTDF
jgi:hypothetical protein